MKKTLSIKNLNCGNCAAKAERAALKVKGVEEVSINFLSEKMIVTAEDANFETILNNCIVAIKALFPKVDIK